MTTNCPYLWQESYNAHRFCRILAYIYYLIRPCRITINRFWNSWIYTPLFCIVATIFMVGGIDVIGVAVLGCVICVLLLFCEDLLSILLPLLLACILTTQHYNTYSVYFQCWWLIIPLGLSLIFHLIMYARPFRSGLCLRSWIMVGVATLLGGIGTISSAEYFSPLSLYYVLGLGVGMLVLYVIVKSQVIPHRSYDIVERFTNILFAAGLFAGVVVLFFYWNNLENFLPDFSTEYFSYRNYCATILLVALPTPCYFFIKKGTHLFGIIFLYAVLLLTGSRSGMVFGTLLLVLFIIYLIVSNKERRRAYIIGISILAIPLIILDYEIIKILFSSRLVDGDLFSLNDSRVAFFKSAIEDFISNPLFGSGLGNMNNGDIFIGVPGSIVWYHNWAAQVFGSMGLAGVIAYGTQLRDRIVILCRNKGPETAMLKLSYLGMFLMSMPNPGEFCPLPNQLLMVFLFAILEDRANDPLNSSNQRHRKKAIDKLPALVKK
jgi:hypothetical protein